MFILKLVAVSEQQARDSWKTTSREVLKVQRVSQEFHVNAA